MTDSDQQDKNKRSIQSVFIHRPMQREFTFVMLGIMMTAAVAVGMVINRTLSALTEGTASTISRTTLERIIYDANSQLVVSSIFIIFIAVIATGLFGVFFLHRVAGPVYRMGQVLKRIGGGEIPGEVHLRRRDFFKETAEELNRVIQLLRELDEKSKAIDQILNQIPKESLSRDVTSKIDNIHKTLTQLRKTPE
jgi:nitrogen fixation/metabolism regulation signal transduction histidine kinase